MASWIDQELAACKFSDPRLSKRFRTLLERLSEAIGESIPMACQDWSSTKAAYRFFSNERFTEEEILAGHIGATRDRFQASEGMNLVLHDTTEFSFQREKGGLGLTRKSFKKGTKGLPEIYTKQGILMHSSLVVTTGGVPLGISAIKFWTRKKFKGANKLKRKINPARVPIGKKESIRWIENLKRSTTLLGEPGRCVHVGDRENDIYEFFCMAKEIGTHFIIRACNDRLAEDGSVRLFREMAKGPIKGLRRIEVRNKKGELSDAVLEIRYRRIQLRPPIGKHKEYPPLTLTVVFAQERGAPKGREKIDWKLITDLPVDSRNRAIEKLEWYALRWKIETFHKILKSGCKTEESKLRTANRLTRLIGVFCILSWRIFWLTMMARDAPEASPKLAFTTTEIQILDYIVKDKPKKKWKRSMSKYLTKLARLGGYLARANDPPPGNKVIWRGLTRLTDIELGVMIGAKLVGN